MPDKQESNRNPDGTFKAGVSGNPEGRPKLGEAWAEVTRELLDSKELTITMMLSDREKKTLDLSADKSFRHAVIIGQINAAIRGSVPAAKELADRSEGKAIERKADVTEEWKDIAREILEP